MSDTPRFEDTEELSFEETEAIAEESLEEPAARTVEDPRTGEQVAIPSKIDPGQSHFVGDSGATIALPEDLQQASLEDDVNRAKAMGYGAIEGTPFAKDLLSHAEALVQNDQDSHGERYQRNKQEWDKAINVAEEKYPSEFITGDIGSGMAFPGLKTVKGAMAFGALSGISRLEDRNPLAVAEAALIGGSTAGVVGKGVPMVAKSLKKVGKAIGTMYGEAGKEAVTNLSAKATKDLNKHIRKHYGKDGMSHVQATLDWTDNLMKRKVDGEDLIQSFQSVERTSEKASIGLNKTGKQIGKVLDVLEDAGKVDTQKIYNKLLQKTGINKRLSSGNSATKVMAKKQKEALHDLLHQKTVRKEIVQEEVLSDILDSSGNPVKLKQNKVIEIEDVSPKKLTAKELFELKQDVLNDGAAVSTSGGKAGKGHEKAMSDKATSSIEKFEMDLIGGLAEGVEEIAEKNAELLGGLNYKELNREYSDYLIVKQITKDAANSVSSGAFGKLRNMLGVRGLLIGNIQAASGANGLLATSVAFAINEISRSPKTSTAVAKGLNKIKDHVTFNPDSPLLKRFIIAAQASSDALREAMPAIVGEVNLQQNPIKRESDEVLLRSDDIISTLNWYDTDLANSLREAIDNDETESVAMLMDQFSKNPSTKHLFEEGLGFNGKVYTPEDKAMLEGKINGMDISLHQKLQHKQALKQMGIIPQPKAEPERFFQLNKRDKSRPDY